jgi:hypothetical protein
VSVPSVFDYVRTSIADPLDTIRGICDPEVILVYAVWSGPDIQAANHLLNAVIADEGRWALWLRPFDTDAELAEWRDLLGLGTPPSDQTHAHQVPGGTAVRISSDPTVHPCMMLVESGVIRRWFCGRANVPQLESTVRSWLNAEP